MAKFISNYAQLKSTKENGSPQKNLSNVSIGMIVGTPGEVLQHIEEGIVVLDEIKYLVSIADVNLMSKFAKLVFVHKSNSFNHAEYLIVGIR